jgi:hypothetical protein
MMLKVNWDVDEQGKLPGFRFADQGQAVTWDGRESRDTLGQGSTLQFEMSEAMQNTK